MKKIFLMIGAAIGALFPFGRANANPTCTNTYVDGSTETSSVNGWGSSGSSNNLTYLDCSCRNSSNKKIKNSVCTYQNAKSELEFDTNENKTKYIFSSCSGGTCNVSNYREYEYDSNGNKTKDSYSECSGGTCNVSNYREYEYDSNGNKTKNSYSECSGGTCNVSNYSEYEYDTNGHEIGNRTFRCNEGICNWLMVNDRTADDYRYKFYDCDEDECVLVGVSSSESFNFGEIGGCSNSNCYSCSNGTCYANNQRVDGNRFYYDNKGSLQGGYSDTCGNDTWACNSSHSDENCSMFTCNTNGCHCTNDESKTVEIPDEYLESPNSFDMPEVTNCGDKYYIKNEYTCSKCPSGSETCYMNDNGQLVTDCKSGYKEQGGGCVTSCDSSYRDMGEWCNKIRWTPAEAAQVLRNDNTNEVTITFRK